MWDTNVLRVRTNSRWCLIPLMQPSAPLALELRLAPAPASAAGVRLATASVAGAAPGGMPVAGPSGFVVGDAAAGHGIVGTAASAAACDLDRDEQSQPEKQQASVAAENLRSSQFVGTEVQLQSAETVEEAASTSLAGRNHSVVTNGGQGVTNGQVSCEGEDMDYDSESDTTSVGETCNRNTDSLFYSLEGINQFLDETFKKSVRVSDYFSDTVLCSFHLVCFSSLIFL